MAWGSAMPNLHGALSELPASAALELAASIAVAAAVWFTARRGSFSIALRARDSLHSNASLVGGLLLSQHSYLLDTAVVLPAALTVMTLSSSKALKVVALLLLVPPTAFLIGVAYPYSAIITGVIPFLWLIGIATEAVSAESPAAEPRTRAAAA